jgi:hypothetical protein
MLSQDVLLFAFHTPLDCGGTRGGGMKRKKIECFILPVIRPAFGGVPEGEVCNEKRSSAPFAFFVPRSCFHAKNHCAPGAFNFIKWIGGAGVICVPHS